MAVTKKHDEFHAIDMSTGWETPPGYPAGIQQKILSGGLDEVNKRGSRTRLLRFDPGDLIVGNDANGNGGESFKPNTYACRPPGAAHGPFKSVKGCTLLEIHYYDPA